MARLLVFDGFVVISAFVFFGYLLGLNKFLSKYGDNGCEMTYMYEYPQFVKVALPPNVTAEYRRYGLYAYSEGRYTQQTRNMQFSGIPVLFIPGQGGSLKQVRSLASVSLRKALGSDSPFHFDYFSLDLNEEYSAMFGGVLLDQTRFAVHAVHRILSLYRRVQPDSIVLIGHSMGGMIAKSMFLQPDFPAYAVHLVLTLATPHSPVVLTDPLLQDYYKSVATSPDWAAASNVTVVSLGGGVKDLVVRSGLTLSEQADISALTTAVPEVWMSVDHLCILWCKQLVLVLVRALFDSVDPHTLQISRDPLFRLEIFRYHLLERSAGKRYHESVHPQEMTLQTGRTEWLELTRPRHTLHRPSLHLPLHLLIHLAPGADTLAVTTSGHKARDWLFACSQISSVNDGRRVCTAVENLSSQGRIAPSKLKKHKVALVNLRDLRARGLHYVVIRLPPSDDWTTVSYDMFTAMERAVAVELPRWSLPFQWTPLLQSTTPDAVFYSLELLQLEKPWQAFHLSLQVLTCINMSHQAVATLRVPWSHQHSSVVLRNSAGVILPVMLHTNKPADWTSPGPYVNLHLDPKCQYSVFVQSSTIESLAQLVRLYSSQLVAYVAAILLLTIRQQLLSLGSQQHCLLFHHALLEGAKPYYILPAVKITSTVLGWRSVPESVRLLLPTPDLSLLQDSSLDFLLLPMFLYLVAYSLTFIIGVLAYIGIVFSGSTVNKLALKFLGKMAGVSRTWTDWLMAAVDKVPCIVSAAMLAVMFSSCGGLAMLIGAVYYFMRVCGMYEDYIEQLFFAPVKYFKDTVIAKWKGRQMPVVNDVIREAEELLSLKGLTEFNFHLTLVMLWGTATIVHLPSVLVWAHNFKYNPVLDPDPAITSSLISSICVAIIWTLDTPICSSSGEMYKSVGNVMFVLACLVLTYCPISLYNLPVLTAAAFVCLAVHQVCEWGSRRWRRDSVPLLVPVSDSPPVSEENSEDDMPAVQTLLESDEEESSAEESDDNDHQVASSSAPSNKAISSNSLKANKKEQEESMKMEILEEVKYEEEEEDIEEEEVDDEEEPEEIESDEEGEEDIGNDKLEDLEDDKTENIEQNDLKKQSKQEDEKESKPKPKERTKQKRRHIINEH